MSKMACGTMRYEFEDLPVEIEYWEHYFRGKVWIEYKAFYDREKDLWDVDYKFDGFADLDLEYPEESIEDLPRQERVRSAVLRELDQDSDKIKEKVIEHVRSW